MVLIHDLVEIDAGDTYAYDEAGAQTKVERETKAADRIFGMLPEDQGRWFRNLWEEFEAYESADAKFAHVLDNCQPLLLNDASNGRSWAGTRCPQRARYTNEMSILQKVPGKSGSICRN